MLGIYCRISVDRKEQKSIKEQRLQGEEFAKSKNLPFKVYIDKGISGGGDISNRPQFEELILDIDSGKLSAVYVYNQDRIAREETTWFTLANLIQEKQIDLYEGNGNLVDLADPNVFFATGLRALNDAYFRRITSVKIKAVLKRNASEGRAHGVLAYGYHNVNGFIAINEEEREAIELIFDLANKGEGIKRIADHLNDKKIPTKYNKLKKRKVKVKDRISGVVRIKNREEIEWSEKTVKEILENTIYKGQRKWKENFHSVPAIISTELWEQVNRKLHDPKRKKGIKGNKPKYEYLLRGKLICSKCGRNYYGRTREDKSDHYYMCSSKRFKHLNCGNRSIGIDRIENLVLLHLAEENKILEHIREHLKTNNVENNINELKSKLKAVESKINKCERDIQKLLDFVLDGSLDASDVKKKNANIKREQEKLIYQADKLREQLSTYDNIEYKIQDWSDDLISIVDRIQNMTFEEKRKLIDKYIKSIFILYSEHPNVDNKDKYYLFVTTFNVPEVPPYQWCEKDTGKRFVYLEKPKELDLEYSFNEKGIPVYKDIKLD